MLEREVALWLILLCFPGSGADGNGITSGQSPGPWGGNISGLPSQTLGSTNCWRYYSADCSYNLTVCLPPSPTPHCTLFPTHLLHCRREISHKPRTRGCDILSSLPHSFDILIREYNRQECCTWSRNILCTVTWRLETSSSHPWPWPKSATLVCHERWALTRTITRPRKEESGPSNGRWRAVLTILV